MHMKRTLTLSLLAAATILTAHAQETYYDITEHYIGNATFDQRFDYDKNATGNVKGVLEIDHWTVDPSSYTEGYATGATFEYGTAATFYDKPIPATGPDGKAEGGCMTLCSGMKKELTYYQEVRMPAGNYLLVVTYNNCNEKTAGTSLSGWWTTAGETLSTLTQFESGMWLCDTIRFSLDATTRGRIKLGFKAGSGMTKSSAMLAIDRVTLLRDTPYGDIDDITPTPVVRTDTRFARGATMAFGRIKSVAGEDLAERGFCYAEHSEPTCDDLCTTTVLSNNGDIYWLKDLKPATKYYMRAYARTTNGKTGYGDVIKFYTIPKGQIGLTIRENDTENTARIRKAAETAVEWWNNLTEMKGFAPNIGYESGTPTADCSYGGWMRVGPNQSYQRAGTIMHEMLHGIGVIPWADTEWARFNLRSGTSNAAGYTTGSGQWLGDRVTDVLRFWDNSTTSVLNGDYQHMWPYGINGASEDNGSDVLYIGNSLICQALGEDGLQHTGSLFAEPYYALDQEDDVKYYIKNESAERGLYTSLLVPNSDGSLAWREYPSEEALTNDSTAWYITFTPQNQYYQFRNAATGRYITYASGKFVTLERAKLTSNDDFHLMKGRRKSNKAVEGERGYWVIHPTSNWTPPCIEAQADGTVSAKTFDIANKAEAQRWYIMSAQDMAEREQYMLPQLQSTITAKLQEIEKLRAVPHTTTAAGTDNTFDTAINDLLDRVQSAQKITDIVSIEDEAVGAALEFLSDAAPTNLAQPFDLTYMLKNPGMDNNEGWSETPTVSNSLAEFYETTFDMNQTVSRLPAGSYIARVQGFQRPGSSTNSYNDWAKGTDRVNAVVYAGSETKKMAHIMRDAQTKKLSGNDAAVGDGYYIPQSMETAATYLKKGFYDNEVVGTVTEKDGKLKLGVRSSNMSSSYWVIVDNFRLHFYGQTDTETLTGIEKPAIAGASTTMTDNIYSLDGRLVRRQATSLDGLQPGLYIMGGKKVVVR